MHIKVKKFCSRNRLTWNLGLLGEYLQTPTLEFGIQLWNLCFRHVSLNLLLLQRWLNFGCSCHLWVHVNVLFVKPFHSLPNVYLCSYIQRKCAHLYSAVSPKNVSTVFHLARYHFWSLEIASVKVDTSHHLSLAPEGTDNWPLPTVVGVNLPIEEHHGWDWTAHKDCLRTLRVQHLSESMLWKLKSA